MTIKKQSLTIFLIGNTDTYLKNHEKTNIGLIVGIVLGILILVPEPISGFLIWKKFKKSNK